MAEPRLKSVVMPRLIFFTWAHQGQKAAGRGLEKSEETKLVRKRWVTGLASSPSFHLSVPSRAEMLICEKTFHFWKGRNCIDSLLHFMKQHLLVKLQGFPGGSVVKNLPNNTEDTS